MRREVAEAFAATGIMYLNTFGGNSVVIGGAVLDAIEKGGLQDAARPVGAHLHAGLGALRALPGETCVASDTSTALILSPGARRGRPQSSCSTSASGASWWASCTRSAS